MQSKNSYKSSTEAFKLYRYNPPRKKKGKKERKKERLLRDGEELPQLPRAYIRVKDENVTVFMVKTYLVRKLGLSNEAEVDVSCMGQKLLHSQTLKHVRDSIWLPRLVESVNSRTAMIENSNEISINHLMSLHYGRRCHLN
ncbi:hypothetical protein F0562_013006 [Nyssa sinensis]|uniref:Ubiquitin-like domain-containing protein n=1 Tax=Nyssa sinensis TaxID=561372 RepID=A0A5J4ZUY0_9ASTE|nr:hypothetical protein F0562_013006 [Nyssa sinensis]